jgi:hypothetical protein
VTNSEQQDQASKAAISHLEYLEALAFKMKDTYQQIQKIALKEPFEFLLPWKWFS